ncbi:MAG: DUF2911 domain-containing protein [Acidobacteriota bacterium]
MNQKNIVRLLLVGAVLSLAAGVAQAQDLHPTRRPSPMAMARVTLDDGTYVRVVYSRPYLRGRDNIFGSEESEALVPFGKVWRTGANEATEITVTGDVMVGDKTVPAGTYSLFTIPGEERWEVHVNSALGLSGTGRFVDGEFTRVDLPATHVAVAEAKATTLEEEVDQFTISFEKVEDGAHMVLSWHMTEVRVPIKPAG